MLDLARQWVEAMTLAMLGWAVLLALITAAVMVQNVRTRRRLAAYRVSLGLPPEARL